ncbi:hypothetical protein [Burkholderia lata]|uniref:hypothetical protein n=1 Tax=Burkholderia lata (strain ATCC 17760 / DSM 23089 / LMG 22485 / NCIMB 9086 / R18194 / 383) TaxID=482957 RepID=UPI001582BACB|nr:hypothetical protein [Burkholderia lata]
MAYTSKTITVANGYGYELYDDSGNLYIHQDADYSVNGQAKPFATADAASAAASAAISAAPTPTTTTSASS